MTGMVTKGLISSFMPGHFEYVPVQLCQQPVNFLLFLALLYVEVYLANLGCNGVILLQFAVTLECNDRYLRPDALQGPLFVNPLPNRACYCLCPLFRSIWR